VNRHLFQKQGFSREAPWTAWEAVHQRTGIYGTAPTCYLSLLARLPAFSFQALDAELYQRKRLVRIRAMRNSLFLLSVENLPVAYQATKELALVTYRKMVAKAGVSPGEYQRLADRIAVLAGPTALTAAGLKERLAPLSGPVQRGFPFILSLMCAEGLLLRSGVRGGWRSDLHEYARFETWLPEVSLGSVTPEQARLQLARLYFQAYAPARRADFHWWSGLPKAQANEAVEALAPELLRLAIHGLDGEYLIFPAEFDDLLGAPEPGASRTSLLPVWDAYMMAYQARERYLPAQWYGRVYDQGGNSTSVVCVEGQVRGVWEFETQRDGLVLKIAWFEEPDPGVWGQIEALGARLGEASGAALAAVLRCPPPPPLMDGKKNRLHAPLKGVAGEAVRMRGASKSLPATGESGQ
jgi:hypothetical protein